MEIVTMRYLMLIKLNGDDKQINTADLYALCNELKFEQKIVATALNGEFIPREDRAQTKITEGDQIEIFAPSQGG